MAKKAIRISAPGAHPDDRQRVQSRAIELGLLGWVRSTDDDRGLAVHAEGDPDALEQLVQYLNDLSHEPATVDKAKVEGHEQFAIRGVIAGVFVVQEHAATARHFDFRLEVDGVMRSWAVPKGPSLDPAVKRFAIQVEDHDVSHNEFEGPTAKGGVIVWDCGGYEQGGRVPWPEALERGHAVFVLHGEKLRGGFALQRTGSGPPSAKPQWLLVKRKDEHAAPGSEIALERPESVLSGGSLDALLSDSGMMDQ
ncbi:MAG: acylphosphatase [Solirubrobacteraceae bacterium]